MNKIESFSARLSRPRKVYPKRFVSDYDIITTEDAVVNNRVMRKSVVKTVHPQDKMAGLNAYDFALENIIAAGAVDMLRDCKLNVNTLGELSDITDASVGRLLDAIDAENNEQNLND